MEMAGRCHAWVDKGIETLDGQLSASEPEEAMSRRGEAEDGNHPGTLMHLGPGVLRDYCNEVEYVRLVVLGLIRRSGWTRGRSDSNVHHWVLVPSDSAPNTPQQLPLAVSAASTSTLKEPLDDALINILAGPAVVILIAGNISSRRQPGKIALPGRTRCSHATAGVGVVLEDVLPLHGYQDHWLDNLGNTVFPHLGLFPTLCDDRPGDVDAASIKKCN